MKLAFTSILAFVTVGLAVVLPHKSVIVSYPDDTPDSIVTQAMDAIKDAGGIVTHEYKLIKGFACKAPAKALEMVQTWGNQHGANVEVDQMVTINSGGSL